MERPPQPWRTLECLLVDCLRRMGVPLRDTQGETHVIASHYDPDDGRLLVRHSVFSVEELARLLSIDD
jgi:hypothetical protein